MAPRRRKKAPLIKKDVARTLTHGSPDEQASVLDTEISKAALEIMQQREFYAALDHFSKAPDPELKPRKGVAMSQIDLGGDRINLPYTLVRPVGLPFENLRSIARKNHFIDMVVGRRIRQVLRYLEEPEFEHQPGFKFRFKNRLREVKDQDQERFTWLRNFLNNCGAEFDPRHRRALQRDSLHEFAQKHLRDSLECDAAPIEYINSESGRLHGFVAVDCANVFLTDPNRGYADEYAEPAEFNVLTDRADFADPRDITAVYAQEGQPRAFYTHMDLLYPVRNRSSEELRFGYGMPEPEDILNISTGILNALTLNIRSISDNSIPRGILSVLGDYNQEDLQHLKNWYLAEMTGVQNRFRLPIMSGTPEQGAGVTFTQTGQPVDEIMYARWISLLVAIVCGKYQILPEEIGFESYTAGRSGLSGSDTEEKIIANADSGLQALLSWVRGTLNEIIQIVDPDVELYFTGLDQSKEDVQQREASIMLFGEVRARHGLSNDDIDEELLKAPVGVVGQAYMQGLNAAQQEKMQEQNPEMSPEMMQQMQEGQQDAGEEVPETTPDDPDHPEGRNGEKRYTDDEGSAWEEQRDQ